MDNETELHQLLDYMDTFQFRTQLRITLQRIATDGPVVTFLKKKLYIQWLKSFNGYFADDDAQPNDHQENDDDDNDQDSDKADKGREIISSTKGSKDSNSDYQDSLFDSSDYDKESWTSDSDESSFHLSEAEDGQEDGVDNVYEFFPQYDPHPDVELERLLVDFHEALITLETVSWDVDDLKLLKELFDSDEYEALSS